MDGYEKLAQSIVVLAAKDYRSSLKKIKRNPKNLDALDTAKQCERFFDSQWFSILTDLDGGWLKKRLREEVVGA